MADFLNRVRQPFNVNSLALAGAAAAIMDEEFISRSVHSNSEGMVQLEEGFTSLGLGWIPSAGNFLLVDLGVPSGPIYEDLLRSGIITRPVGNYGLPNHLRITVGSDWQNAKLVDELSSLVSKMNDPAA